MQSEVVILAHPDQEYVCRLADYLNEHELLPCKAVAFTEKEKIKAFETTHKVVMKVIPEEWAERKQTIQGRAEGVYSDSKKGEQKSKILYISEEEKEDEMYAYRYQPADLTGIKICLAAGLEAAGKRKRYREEDTKLIGVYSPVGRSLKTSFSLTLGQMLAVKYKVLYLNFENYSGFHKLLGYEKPSDMADLLFSFLNLSDEFPGKMQESTFHLNGMDLIPPALSFMDLESISEGEWEVFFTSLLKKRKYDFIILDLADHIKGLYEILRRCSLIYTPVPGDRFAKAKEEQYELLLSQLNYGEILERTKKFSPPVFTKLPMKPEELVHSELAEYAKMITEEDFHWKSG